jgi:2-polyprenyl-3-methyl-5-hydroxy-6-metoxy-1,4-benzoquinol methylase
MGLGNAKKIVVNDPCICCGASSSSLLLRTRFPQYPGYFDYRRCDHCEIVFNSPRLADLSSLYDQDYFFYLKDASSMRYHVLRQIQHLVLPAEYYAPGKRLIEIGSARGHLLNTLQQLGYNVTGVEPSADAVAYARSTYNLPMFQGTAEDYASGHQSEFDIAFACTVIEHVGSPDVFVRTCRSLLKPGGLLVMDMPNGAAHNASTALAAWEMYQKYHIFLFTPDSIGLLLKKLGFEIIRTFSYDNSPLTRAEIRHLKRNYRLLVLLDSLGLYLPLRTWYRKRSGAQSKVSTGFKPISKEDLQKLAQWESSGDAKASLAANQQGDHIVVIARKIVTKETSVH